MTRRRQLWASSRAKGEATSPSIAAIGSRPTQRRLAALARAMSVYITVRRVATNWGQLRCPSQRPPIARKNECAVARSSRPSRQDVSKGGASIASPAVGNVEGKVVHIVEGTVVLE